MTVAAALRFRSISAASQVPSTNSNTKPDDDNCVVVGSPSNRSLSEWSDPREADDDHEADFVMMKDPSLSPKAVAAAVASSSSSSTAVNHSVMMATTPTMMMSVDVSAATATADETTPKRKTPSLLSSTTSTAANVVTPDVDDNNQRQTVTITNTAAHTAAAATSTQTSTSAPANGDARQAHDDDEQAVDDTLVLLSGGGDADGNNDDDCKNCAFQIPCFLLPFLRQLDLIPFAVNHHDRRHHSSSSSPRAPPLSSSGMMGMMSHDITTTTAKTVDASTFNVDREKQEQHQQLLTTSCIGHAVQSTSGCEWERPSAVLLPGLLPPGNEEVKRRTLQEEIEEASAAVDDVVQRQQQLRLPSHQAGAPILLRDVDDNNDNFFILHKIDNNMLQKPGATYCRDNDDIGGLHDNMLQEPAATAAAAATAAYDTAISSFSEGTKSNKNNNSRRFLFAKNKKNHSSPSVISSSRSLAGSILGSQQQQQNTKKNHFKSFFSSSKNNISKKQPPPPLVHVVSSTSPRSPRDDDDEAHGDCLVLNFSRLDDDESPPFKRVKQQTSRTKEHGRLSSSSSSPSFFRSPALSDKNKVSSPQLSPPQKYDEPEQNPRPCQGDQKLPQKQQLRQHQRGSGTMTTTTATIVMTPASSLASSPLSLDPLSLPESTSTLDATTSMEWLLSRQACLQEEMHNLFELEKASQHLEQRAIETTRRISQLTDKTMQLQEALQQALSSLQQETACIQQVEVEQARIEHDAHQLHDSICQGLRRTTSTSKTVTTMTTTSETATTVSVTSGNGRPPAPRAATSVNTSTYKSDVTASRRIAASPIIPRHDQQQSAAPPCRRRAATEDPSTPAQHHYETFPRPELQQEDLMLPSLPEQPTTIQLSTPPTLPRRRANTEPIRPLAASSVASFMRVSDLEMDVDDISSSSLSLSFHATSGGNEQALATTSTAAAAVADKQLVNRLSNQDFFFLDENIALILDKLTKLGLEVSTDESQRFTPTRETQWLLQGKSYVNDLNSAMQQGQETEWPFSPWHAARDKDVLVWTGGVPHKGFGHDWPVVKARGIVRTTPRKLLDFLLDSNEIKRYNKMSQGREDVYILQAGVDTKADESLYGFAGDVRILRALNKPKLLPKTMEMLSLWYSQPLEEQPGSYMIVSRSVWENELGTAHYSSSPSSLSLSAKSYNHNNNNLLRCEMLLGVQLLRPVTVPSIYNNKPSSMTTGCELTTITHVFSTGVPELMAKRAAPSSAANLIRELQTLFP